MEIQTVDSNSVNMKSNLKPLSEGTTMMTFANGTMKVPNFIITNVKSLSQNSIQTIVPCTNIQTIVPSSNIQKIVPSINKQSLNRGGKMKNVIVSPKTPISPAVSSLKNVTIKQEMNIASSSEESPQWLKSSLKQYVAKKRVPPSDSGSSSKPCVDDEHAYVSKYQSPIITMKKINYQQNKIKPSNVADHTCRLCLQTKDTLTPLICGSGAKPELNVFLKECCSIEVTMEDPMPKAICCECIIKLQSAWDFRNLCQKSDNELRKFYKLPVKNYSQVREDNYVEKIDKGIQVESYDRSKRKEMRELSKRAIKQEAEEQVQTPEEQMMEQRPEGLIEYLQEDEAALKADYGLYNEGKEENAVTYFLESFAQEISNDVENSEDGRPTQFKDAVSDSQKTIIPEEPKKPVIRRRKKPNEEKLKYLCHMCPRVFTSKAFLDRHSNFHLTEKNFTCETCSKAFKTDEKLQSHMKIHDKTKRFECEVCGLKYVYEYLLNSHLRLHGKGKPLSTEKHFLCEVCSKTFASQSGLKHHQKLHMDLKPFKCRFCEKTFTMPIYRKKHELRHSDTRRYSCHLCPATYHSTNGLTNHLLLHTGEAHYHCKTCGKSFRRRKYLNEHIFTHTGEKPYICKMCGIGYGNSGSLFAHQKRCRAQFAEEAMKNMVEEVVETENLVEEFFGEEQIV